jgi:hypothetical protein
LGLYRSPTKSDRYDHLTPESRVYRARGSAPHIGRKEGFETEKTRYVLESPAHSGLESQALENREKVETETAITSASRSDFDDLGLV